MFFFFFLITNLSNFSACTTWEFGCCPDNVTLATGPFLQGCSNCSLSEFGCCPDNFTEATGPENEGCKGEKTAEQLQNADVVEAKDDVEGSGEAESSDQPPCEGDDCPKKLCTYENNEGTTVHAPCVNLTEYIVRYGFKN